MRRATSVLILLALLVPTSFVAAPSAFAAVSAEDTPPAPTDPPSETPTDPPTETPGEPTEAPPTASPPAAITPALVPLRALVPPASRSEKRVTIEITTNPLSEGSLRLTGSKGELNLPFTADSAGNAKVSFRPWKSAMVTIVVGEEKTNFFLVVSPSVHPLKFPRPAPAPPKRYLLEKDPPAVGAGPNPVVKRLSKEQMESMKGLSWRPGCVPFSNLRAVSVNYYGTDGYRYRGLLISRDYAAARAAKAFSALYKIKYRFRSIHPVDRYGKNPRGPGADDYESMLAGNTSMFNCRLVVGAEDLGRVSPHASGTAIDINTFENPYVSRRGVYPNSWWLSRSRNSPMVLTQSSKAVKIMRAFGWSWGGSYRDYQHFDFRG